MALMLYSPQNDGGAEVNGIISFIIWCLWIYLLKKGYAIASSILSTIVSVGIKVYKFGVGDNIYMIQEATGTILAVIIMCWVFFRVAFGRTGNNRSSGRDLTRDFGYSETNDYDYGYNTEKDTHKLISGSDEYWQYKENAESIYRAFCDARTIDERRYFKKQGERLKAVLEAKYGENDYCVRSIADSFLDLRM